MSWRIVFPKNKRFVSAVNKDFVKRKDAFKVINDFRSKDLNVPLYVKRIKRNDKGDL